MRFRNYVHQHILAIKDGLRDILWQPVGSLMTLFVLAFTCALPLGLKIFSVQVHQWSHIHKSHKQLSVYLNPSLSTHDISGIKAKILALDEVETIDVIPKAQGLEILEKNLGLKGELQAISPNPLPTVFELKLAATKNLSMVQIKQLKQRLSDFVEVDLVNVDKLWFQTFNSIIDDGQRILWILSIILLITAALVVMHTIHLFIQSHSKQIEILKLVGASNAYIARPFLYVGILFGGLGALGAIVIVVLFMSFLLPAVKLMGSAFSLSITLNSFSLYDVLVSLGMGGILGLFSAFLATWRYTRYNLEKL